MHNLPYSAYTDINNLNNNPIIDISKSTSQNDYFITQEAETLIQSPSETNIPTTLNIIPNIPVSNMFQLLATKMDDEPEETLLAQLNSHCQLK